MDKTWINKQPNFNPPFPKSNVVSFLAMSSSQINIAEGEGRINSGRM